MEVKTFEFDGNWEFDLELSEFKKIFSFSGNANNPKFRDKFYIKFLDRRDYEPDPTKEQLNALQFIINNQTEIINSIYNHISNIVFPLHKTYIDDEEIFFPKITSSEGLSKVLGLNDIIIHLESKDSISYVSYVFGNFSADNEHGQTITLHKLQYLHSGETWEYKPIYEDLNLDYKIKDREDTEEYLKFRSKPLIFQKPIEKYNRLKPWQKEINELYPVRLIKNGENDRFINFIEFDFTADQYQNLNTFLYWAQQSKNNEIESYLVDKLKQT